MPKPNLEEKTAKLEDDIIETLLAGLHEWRPDLNYPESDSDMQACVRGLLKMFDITRSPLPKPLRLQCCCCDGIGKLISKESTSYVRYCDLCPECRGKGYINGD